MKRALILGAAPGSGNIGENIALALREIGWETDENECLSQNFGRPRGSGNATDDDLRSYGYKGGDGEDRYCSYELPSFEAFQGAYDALIVTLGRTYKDHFAGVPPWVLEGVLKANLMMPLEAARRFVQANEQVPQGSLAGYRQAAEEGFGVGGKRWIIFIGSYAHRHPFTNGTLYCAAKAGLDMAAQTLGWELTDLGYRIHVVHPYHVQGTPMWARVERDVMESKDMTYAQADAYNRKDLKMPDLLTPREVAEVVRTLLTEPAMEWMSGTRVELNGGSR